MIADKIQQAEHLQQEGKFLEACTLWQEVCSILPVYTAAYFHLAQSAEACHNTPLSEWAYKQLQLFIPQNTQQFHSNGFYTHQAIIKIEYKPEVILPPSIQPPALPPQAEITEEKSPVIQADMFAEVIDTTPIMPPELLEVQAEIEWKEEVGYPELSWQTLENTIDTVEIAPKGIGRIHPKMQVDLGFDSLDDLISQLEKAPRMKPIVGEVNDGEDDDDLQDLDLDDMVSETLALIYAKQKQFDEAAEIYDKLVLQEPERATYFQQKAIEMRSK